MHIFEREIKGRRYRVLATSRRVKGKKHPVSRQVSLGPVGDDVAFCPAQATTAGHRRVGDVGALIAVADELGVLDAFDAACPGDGDSPSLGEMILAVALQRVCCPRAKVHLDEFLGECLPRFSAQRVSRMNGAAFHRVTRGVEDDVYDQVQLALAKQACRRYQLDTDVLAYDTTNFDTFIATETPGELARRGHAKSKRSDLRVVGLALMTSGTESVPLFHRTYAGNSNDVVVLTQTLEALSTLHDSLGGGDRTLVRDGGFSAEQLELDLGDTGYHSLTCLAVSTKAAGIALAQSIDRLKPLSGKLRDVRAHRLRMPVGSLDRTLVVIESPDLLRGQLRGVDAALKKALGVLGALGERLKRQAAGKQRGRRLTISSLTKRISKLTAREHVADLLRVDIGGEEKMPTLRFEEILGARDLLIRERLGKRVLLTDQHEWSTERIVRAYRSQWKVERAFRRMKRGAVAVWGPCHQWTDDSLRAHTFATVLGLQLASLAKLKFERATAAPMSAACFLELLSQIRLTKLLVKSGGRGGPRTVFIGPQLNRDAQIAIKTFELDRWSPIISATT